MTARSRERETPVALLTRCDPFASAPVATHEVEDALAEIAQAIMRQPRRPRPRRRMFAPPLRIALVLAAVGVLIAGVATAAVTLHAHTGLFASKAEVPMSGPGEQLNPAAPDFSAVALKLAADIPYPVGYESWREWVLSVQAPKGDVGSGAATFPAGLVTTGALRGWFAASAFCAWVQSWRQATVTGDSAAAAQAAQTIAAAPSWKAVTAEDLHPNPSRPNDPGAKAGTLFGWMLPYRHAVASGDRGKVEQLLASGYGDGRCWLSDPAWMAEWRSHSGWSKLPAQDLASRYEQFLARERS